MEPAISSKNHPRRRSPLSSSDADITVRRRRRGRKTDEIDKDHDEGRKELGNIGLTSQESYTNSETNKNLAQFRKYALATSQASFWSKPNATTLMKHVVSTSLSLFQKGDCSSSLLLESGSSELLSSCRALVKEATEEDKRQCETIIEGKDTAEYLRGQRHRLFVSTHGLRALICTQIINDGGKRDAILRLLYFCIVTAASIFSSADTFDDAKYLCYSAYHALSLILQNYNLSGKDAAFTCRTAQPTPSNCVLTFPVPFPAKKKSEFQKNSTDADQICTMCIAANLSMARIVSKLVPVDSTNDENCDFCPLPFATKMHDPVDFLRYLVLDVTVPWIACMVKICCVGDLLESRHQNNILSNCKKAHRVLVDAAEMIQDNVESRLQLQKDAVFALLLNQNVAVSMIVPDISTEHNLFSQACTFSWKVAESAKTKLGRNESNQRSALSVLQTFHDPVGVLLDSFQEKLSTCPFSYVEFCSYRALHTHPKHDPVCTDDGCLFRRLPYRFQHSCSKLRSNNFRESFMALFFLTSQVCRSLECTLSHKRAASDEFSHLQESQISSAFRLHFVAGKEIDSSTRLRCYNILCSISLHRVVFRILNECQDGLFPHELLNVSGKILSNCIGPFCFGLINHVTEKERRPLWFTMASCFQQAIAVEELNVSCNSFERSNKLSEELMRNLLPALNLEPPSDCLENSAKFLYSVGKKRFEGGRMYDSLLPLIYSVKLLVHLATTKASDSISSLKISNRFALISSIYKSLNMLNEAIIATLMALLFDAVEVSIAATACSNSLSFLFSLLASMTENIVDTGTQFVDDSRSEHRIGLQSTFINLYLKRTKVNCQTDVVRDGNMGGLTPTKAIDLLLASSIGGNSCDLFEQYCYLPFDPGKLMKSVFSCEAVTSFSKKCKRSVEIELLKITIDMIVRVGSLLQKNEGESLKLSDHADLCLLAESLLRSTRKKATLKTEMTDAMLNIVASVSLVSSHRYVSLESLLLSHAQGVHRKEAPYVGLAQDYAAKSNTILENALEKLDDLDPILFAVDLALDLYQYQLSCMHPNQIKSFRLGFKRLKTFMDNFEVAAKKESSFLSAWIYCLRSTLSKLCGMFSFEGEGFLSLQLAKWKLDAFRRCNNADVNGQLWSESVLLTVLSYNSVVVLSDFKKQNGINSLEALIQSCRLRLFIRGLTDDASLQKSRIDFLAMLDNLNDPEVTLDFELQWIALWTRSTIFLGLAECTERQGLLLMSQHHIRSCFEICKDLSSILKRNKGTFSSGASSLPFWMRVSSSFISLICSKRQTDCLLRIACLRSRLGDYRQSIEYSFLPLMTPSLEAADFDSKKTFSESVTLTRKVPALNSHEAFCRRVFLRYKSKASPNDLVNDVFKAQEDSPFLSLVDRNFGHDDVLVNRELEKIVDMYEIVDMTNGYQAFPAPISGMALHKMATKDFIRHQLTPQVSKIYDTVALVSGCVGKPYLQLQYDAKLRDASIVLTCELPDSIEAYLTATGWLQDIVSAPNCEPLCRSWSFYLLGSLSLKTARRNGDLHRKWNCLDPSTYSSRFLSEAQKYFENSLLLLGSSCDILKRNVLRSLALVNGPGISNRDDAMECFRLINSSVGSSIKTRMLGIIHGLEHCDEAIESEIQEFVTNVFDALENIDSETDDSRSTAWFLRQLGQIVPKEWRFVTVVLCPSGELLFSSLEFSEFGDPLFSNACVDERSFKETDAFPKDDLYDFIVKPLKEIIHRSEAQLSDNKNGLAQSENSRQDQTRKWWNTRKDIDSDLQEHIENVERVLLSSDDVRRVLCGESSDRYDFADESLHSTRGNLTSRFDAARSSDEINKPKSYRCTGSQQSVCNTAETMPDHTRVSEAKRKSLGNINSTILDSPDPREEPTNECTFLILDENLLSFPLEGLQCFGGKALCRIPSLPFLLATLSTDKVDRCHQRSIKPEKTSFILDPESNLTGTKERMEPFISSLQAKSNNCWRGLVGVPPSDNFMDEVLSQRDGLLLYFGHGGGQQFFSRAKIESLRRQSGKSLASLILMGCGSGRLESVNTKKSNSTTRLPIHYDPEGIALSYLLAGSPCVVGNLWDVTDRDIDRYSMALVESIFNDNAAGGKSIAKCVAESRAACKMRYIVGCAPVCYGIPVIASKQMS